MQLKGLLDQIGVQLKLILILKWAIYIYYDFQLLSNLACVNDLSKHLTKEWVSQNSKIIKK